MSKMLKLKYLFISALVLFITPISVLAQIKGRLDGVGKAAGYKTNTGLEVFNATAGKVIYALMSLLGIIFIFLIIYGGYMWMTARGNDQQLEKAKNIITRAIIGVIVVAGSYAIWAFIAEYVL